MTKTHYLRRTTTLQAQAFKAKRLGVLGISNELSLEGDKAKVC